MDLQGAHLAGNLINNDDENNTECLIKRHPVYVLILFAHGEAVRA